jgi:tRNA nucleotidyltransferase (CCA-adding enzyme)
MTCLASGIILYRRSGSGVRLLLLRNRDDGHWGFAKGRRAPGDAHEIMTARREVEEETGYRDLAIDPVFRSELSYRAAQPDGGTRPKRVSYFLAEAPAHEPALSEEHDEVLWADLAELDHHLRHDQLRRLARAALDAAGAG